MSSFRCIAAVAGLVAMSVVHADAGQARVDAGPDQSTSSEQGERRAVPRAAPAPAESRPAPAVSRPAPAESRPAPTESRPSAPRAEAPRSEPRARTPRSAAVPQAEAQGGQAVPRGSRPQGDNPRTGTAAPRENRPSPPVGGGGTVIVTRPQVYTYYYPQRYYPYGYGGFGLGYFYYDPYSWYPGVYSGYGYNSPYNRYYGVSQFDSGELRLLVSPRDAQVFVDGYYAGVVDDFDGIVQALRLESGPYSIEIVAPGYETLQFDVRITRGRKITYRGTLMPRP